MVMLMVLAQPIIPLELIPPDTPQKVVDEIRNLYSDYPHVRGEAASKLGWMGDSAKVAIPFLLAMFHDERSALAYPNPFGAIPDWSDCPAKRAAFALASIGGSAIDSLLFLYINGDGKDSIWSLIALTQSDDSKSTPILIEYLKETKYLQELDIGGCVYKHDITDQLPLPIATIQIQQWAIESLGERRDTSAVTVLIEIACDSVSKLREESIKALGEIGDWRAVHLLINLLNQQSLTGNAASALAYIGDPCAIKPLLLHLKDKSGNYNTSVLVALGDFKSEETLNAILPALRSSDISVRSAAVTALGASGRWGRPLAEKRRIAAGRAPAVEPLIEALHDPVPEIRQEVMRTLVTIGDKRAIVPLYNIVKKNKPDLDKWWAEDALIDITGEDFRQYDGSRDKWIEWQRKWIPGFQKSVADQLDSVKVSTPNITIVEDARLPKYARIEVEVNNQTGHYLDCRWLSCQYKESFSIDPSRSNKVLVYSWDTETQDIASITIMPLVISYRESTFSEILIIYLDWTQAIVKDIAPREDWLVQSYPNPFSGQSHATIFTAIPTAINVLLFDREGQFVDSLFQSALLRGLQSIPLNYSTMASGIYLLRLDVNGQPLDMCKYLMIK